MSYKNAAGSPARAPGAAKVDAPYSSERLFLHDELRALLSSTTLASVSSEPEDAAETELEDEKYDTSHSDDAPSERPLDVNSLRDALDAGLR